jgi:anaerobic ribonucleoside-triphosphate reductase activating protein
VGSVVEWVAAQFDSQATGVTITGGEPFDQPEGLEALIERLRREPALVGADILAYSGYTFSQLARRHGQILGSLDAVMSGPFVRSRPTALPWRGSSNQRLTLLTERAHDRFAPPAAPPPLQVSADGEQLWITGIPRRGDLERLERALALRGVELKEPSWRT